MKYEETTWNGQPWEDLSDNHLTNVRTYIEERVESLRGLLEMWRKRGQMAQHEHDRRILRERRHPWSM